ncbi:MAG: hypothetical protein LUC83_08860 [Clostridiales bacterium]|nr:hypothetical protein [Clostridiales bacterium]
MQKKKTILNLFIAAEAIILVVVLAVGGVFGSGGILGSRISGDSASTLDPSVISTEDNAIDSDGADAADTDNSVDSDGADGTGDNAITGSSDQDVETTMTFSDEVEDKIDEMTVEEQVAQLFVTTPEELTGVAQVTIAGEGTQAALETYPVAGLVYSGQNFISAEQLSSMLASTQGYSQDSIGLDLFTIVEEVGGENHSPLATALTYETIASPADLAEEENPETVYSVVQTKAAYVAENGFTTVLAPVADVATGTDTDFDEMTYGSEEVNVSEYVEMDIEGTQAAGVDAILRAFPGIQQATEDYTVYQTAIDSGVNCIQVSNNTYSALTGDDSLPCSLSKKTVTQLRSSMGFEGVLMTSDLAESAVLEYCSTEEAAVTAISVGMDLVYVTDGFEEAYQAVLDAVNDGTITKVRLHNSVGRVLSLKME